MAVAEKGRGGATGIGALSQCKRSLPALPIFSFVVVLRPRCWISEDDDEHDDDRVAATPRCNLRDLCVSLPPFPEAKRDAYVVRKFFMSGGSGDEKEKAPSNSNDRAEACRA
jgi:hypothetical protein